MSKSKKIEFEETVLEYTPYIGAVAFSVYIAHAADPTSTLRQLADRLHLSIPTVVKCNKLLTKYHLIVRNEADLFDVVTTDIPSPVKLSEANKDQQQVIQAFDTIVKRIYSHPRYSRVSRPIYTERARVTLMNLFTHDVESVEAIQQYCDWWLQYKLKLSFSLGLFCCNSMISEYQNSARPKKITLKQSQKRTGNIERAGAQLEAEAVRGILAKRKRGEKLTVADKQLLREVKNKLGGKA